MSNGQRLATAKQLAYIERLSADSNATIEKPLDELTMEEASELIDQLLDKVNGTYSATNRKQTNRSNSWSSGARIGLAFKVCYHRWVSSGTNIFKHKEQFVENVLGTYNLLNEIAQKAEAA